MLTLNLPRTSSYTTDAAKYCQYLTALDKNRFGYHIWIGKAYAKVVRSKDGAGGVIALVSPTGDIYRDMNKGRTKPATGAKPIGNIYLPDALDAINF